MNSLAKFVKERRKEVRLTQEDFADRAGVALTVVRKIEQGKTNLNILASFLMIRKYLKMEKLNNYPKVLESE